MKFTGVSRYDQFDLYGFVYFGILISIVFIISGILFEDLIMPILVIATIPISYIGIFVIFRSTESRFDEGGITSFIVLGAIVSSIMIYLLNELNHGLRNIGDLTYNDMMINVLISNFSTVSAWLCMIRLPLMPFLYAGQTELFWFSYALGMIGGIIVLPIIMLIVLPVLLWKRPTASDI